MQLTPKKIDLFMGMERKPQAAKKVKLKRQKIETSAMYDKDGVMWLVLINTRDEILYGMKNEGQGSRRRIDGLKAILEIAHPQEQMTEVLQETLVQAGLANRD